MHLINVLLKKKNKQQTNKQTNKQKKLNKQTEGSQVLLLSLSLFFFIFLLLSIYIPMLFCKFYTQFRKKKRIVVY
jgi:cytoskeletal protein RodZ